MHTQYNGGLGVRCSLIIKSTVDENLCVNSHIIITGFSDKIRFDFTTDKQGKLIKIVCLGVDLP